MYWRFPSSRIPRPAWSRDALANRLPPFLPVPQPVTDPDLQAYCQFYGLDLEHRFAGVEHRLGVLASGGFRIAVHEYLQSGHGGTVFVLHGYFDHAGLYARLFADLLGRGFNIVCYDLPGHGLSSGEAAAIRDFADYQQVLASVLDAGRGHLPGPWHAIGQSTGGAVLIDFLLSGGFDRHSSPFKEVVLLAPLVRPMGWSAARVLHALLRPFRSTWKRAFTRNSGNQRFLQFLKDEDPLQSRVLSVTWVSALKAWIPWVEQAAPIAMDVTVIQGQRDKTVDWPYNLGVIRDKFPGSRVCILPEGHHHLVNEKQPLLDELFGLIADALAGDSLPGNAEARTRTTPIGETE
ncbi:MAG: lysophospholipase [Alteromonadaceae bacterium]|nr:lysophospholipase [Alteromonadaceae bacterium]